MSRFKLTDNGVITNNGIPLNMVMVESQLNKFDRLINSPEILHFTSGVALEAAHQRDRWGSEHDEGKEPEDWFWLIGYLAGKALSSSKNGDTDKALHHTISTSAVLANWHAAISKTHTEFRPGLSKEDTKGYE